MTEKFAEFRMSEIFPKTFAYLKFSVPLRNPDYLKKVLPDPIVEFLDKHPKKRSVIGSYSDEKIKIYLLSLLEYETYFNLSKYDFHDKSLLLKFSKLIDSQPRLQVLLVHEYEHCIQKKLGVGKTAFDIRHIADFDTHTVLGVADYLRKYLSQKYQIKLLLVKYGLNWREVGARLSEWIFLKIKDYDHYSICVSDFLLQRDITVIRRDYEAVTAGIIELKHHRFKNWFKLKRLRYIKYLYEEFIKYHDKMNKEAENIAKELRQKYIEFKKA